jgi:hypothetical protein
MKPFKINNTKWPWRIMVPAKFCADKKRKTKYCKTEKDALAFCRKAKEPGWTFDGFLPPVSKTKEDEWNVALRRFHELYGGDVGKAFAAHDRLHKLAKLKSATVREAIEDFQTWRQTQVGIKWEQSTVTENGYHLNKLILGWGSNQLSDLTTVALREFFDEVKGDRPTIYKSISVFFVWAVKRNYLAENPLAPIEKKKEIGEFGVNDEPYPVPTFRRMLRIAAGLDPVGPGAEPTRDFIELGRWFVLSGFLGLRSCEAKRENRKAEAIRWTDLHWNAEVPYVEVRDEVAKSTKRKNDARNIETPHYLEAAKAWLDYMGPNEGPYIVRWTKRQIQELKRRFTKATKIKFIENGFRNSFATYALTYNGLQGVGKLALEMGNSEDICKRHYVKNIAPGSGRAWFSLRPFEVVSSAAATA